MRSFLQSLVVVALVLAGVSPACKFISGQTTLIEVCGAFGLKTVEVPVDQAPGGERPNHKKADDCAFCFAASHYAGLKAASVAAVTVQTDLALFFTPVTSSPTIMVGAHSPRGPPSFSA